MKRKLVFIITYLLIQNVTAQIAIIPQPLACKMGQGELKLGGNFGVTGDAVFESSLHYLRKLMLGRFGISTYTSLEKDAKMIVKLDSKLQHEAYRLNIDRKGIAIYASDRSGIVNALASLEQVFTAAERKGNAFLLPVLNIEDKPQFGWRGFMLDESRHFFGKEKVKSLLDWMAFYWGDRQLSRSLCARRVL